MYYLCSENKGADQLRGYRVADLLFALSYAKYMFSHYAAQYMTQCKNKFYLVKVLKGFNCVWWFIRVVLHVGSVCQSDIRLSDCLDLFRRPAPAITRVEILYEVDLFNKLTSRFVSLKNK